MRAVRDAVRVMGDAPELDPFRSEEHTSELQSRQYLVCRLLLEKTQTHDLLLDRYAALDFSLLLYPSLVWATVGQNSPFSRAVLSVFPRFGWMNPCLNSLHAHISRIEQEECARQ